MMESRVVRCPNCDAPLCLRIVDQTYQPDINAWFYRLETVENWADSPLKKDGRFLSAKERYDTTKRCAVSCPRCNGLVVPIGRWLPQKAVGIAVRKIRDSGERPLFLVLASEE